MHIVRADDPVRPVPLSFRASARTGVGIRFPLPPSAREVAARSADGGSDIARQFLSPIRLRRQPPHSEGLAARRCRADGTSYPKGICSAALHCRTPSPTGGSTHLPRRATRPQAFPHYAVRPPDLSYVTGIVPPIDLSRDGAVGIPNCTFPDITKPRDFRRGVSLSKKPVIASQSADWRGNPFLNRIIPALFRRFPAKRIRIPTPVTSVTGSE